MRVECEDGTAAWLVGTLTVPSVQGHGLPLCRNYGPISVFFSSLLQLVIRRPLWPVFVCNSTGSGTQRAPLPGVLFYLLFPVSGTWWGGAWLESYSVDRQVRHLKGHPGWGPTL